MIIMMMVVLVVGFNVLLVVFILVKIRFIFFWGIMFISIVNLFNFDLLNRVKLVIILFTIVIRIKKVVIIKFFWLVGMVGFSILILVLVFI